MDFKVFKTAIAAQFEKMKKYPLFRVGMSQKKEQEEGMSFKDKLWDTYLDSFPPGTNEVYRERREYDCSCCRQFIRAVGDVVAIKDGKIISIWDTDVGDPNFQVVADALSALVHKKKIRDIFLHFEPSAGADKTFEQLVEGGQKAWNHFFINIPRELVRRGSDIASELNGPRTNQEVLMRALTELTDDAVDTVLDLIAQGSLYRGDESKGKLQEFRKLKTAFNKLTTDKDRIIFTWIESRKSDAVSRIRNSALGTLLVDLSAEMDLEDAVRRFEAVMAPSNYQRPTALVTKAMIEKAKKQVEELGLTSSLQRRYANLRDITANNVLWVNRTTRKKIDGDVFDDMAAETSSRVKAKNLDKVEEVPIEKFISDILPRAEGIEVLLENRHASNLVSLIAPSDATAGDLFKWDNKLSWSYNGEMADSIKERVKKAGGNVTGELCCRLAWFNHDDLDFHMMEPDGHEIYFGSKSYMSNCGGRLDVDMNAGVGTTREPVENIFYTSTSKMKLGVYRLFVHQFRQRETTDEGFEVEVDLKGTIYRFAYPQRVRQDARIQVAEFHVQKNGQIEVVGLLPSTTASKTVWGIPTETYHPVNVMCLSPNFWDGQKGIGNKHYFFMLEGCKNDASARGFFNEFLSDKLKDHRKVLEMVGGKLKVAECDDQLSGLGFSSTQQNSLLCRVKGSFTRTIKVVF